MYNETPAVLQFVVFIVDWPRIKMTSTLFRKGNERFHWVCKGLGTASSEILDMLGIGSIEKAVIICLEDERHVPAMLKEVGEKLGLQNRGAGIGFTVPLSAVTQPVLKIFNEISRATPDEAGGVGGAQGRDTQERGTQEGEQDMHEEIKYDLIVAVLNQGYSEEFMKVAREAGAGGGTVINARGLSGAGTKKIFGISVQDEKEIIIILSTHKKKSPIMSAVSKSHGVSTKADGLIFSLPVDEITGVELR